MKSILLVIALLGTSLFAADDVVSRVCGKLQSAIVKDHVQSSRPLKRAVALLYKSKSEFESNSAPLVSGKTNRWGNFQLGKVPSGTYFLVVKTAEGHEYTTSVIVDTKIQMLCSSQGYEVSTEGKLGHWVTIEVD
jgi:hypothetical protein